MKKYLLSAILFMPALMFSQYSLNVKLGKLKSAKGNIIVSVYSSPGTFLSEKNYVKKNLEGKIKFGKKN